MHSTLLNRGDPILHPKTDPLLRHSLTGTPSSKGHHRHSQNSENPLLDPLLHETGVVEDSVDDEDIQLHSHHHHSHPEIIDRSSNHLDAELDEAEVHLHSAEAHIQYLHQGSGKDIHPADQTAGGGLTCRGGIRDSSVQAGSRELPKIIQYPGSGKSLINQYWIYKSIIIRRFNGQILLNQK